MRKIQVQAIEEAVYELFLQANYSIEPGIEKAITEAVEQETSDAGRFVLK
jgi:tartrate dehydratase alpha subunit/fumarate hydratase class I-like protein